MEHSRHTYYTVLAQRKGLRFPRDVAVYPVRHSSAGGVYGAVQRNRSSVSAYTVRGEHQYFGGAFLPAREQVQYLTIRPVTESAGLRFEFAREGGVIKNDLPFDISRLVVHDAEGKLWEAEEIDSGDSAMLRPTEPGSITELINTEVLPTSSELPMQENRIQVSGGGISGIRVSQLERRLKRWSTALPRNTFLGRAAVVGDQIGVENGELMDSVHVLMGMVE